MKASYFEKRRLATRAVVSVWLSILALWLSPERSHAVADRIRLVWNDDPATTVVIAWDQTSGDNASVRYDTEDFGASAASYRFERTPDRVTPYMGMNNHFAILKDLRSDTIYYFVIQDDEGVGDRLWFRTGPSLNRPFTFVAGGDTGAPADLAERALPSFRMVAKLRPLFVVLTGDFCLDDDRNEECWREWLWDWSVHARAEDGRVFPLVPAAGNEEAHNLAVLSNLFDAPYQRDDVNNVYYGLDIGHTLFHLVVLNTEVYAGGYQRAWLERDLAAHRGFELLAAAYDGAIRPHSFAEPERDDLYESWAGLFYDYGVDLAFEGGSGLHKVTYPVRPSEEPGQSEGFIRDDLFGTMYVGEGGWGGLTDPTDDLKPWTMTSDEMHQMKWIHVHPAEDGEPGRALVHTVVTGIVEDGVYEEQESGVVPNDENDVFAIPEGALLAETPDGDRAVAYPLDRQLTGYSFQQGMNGYGGALDISIWENAPDTPMADRTVAAAALSSIGGTRQALIKFANIFGDQQWQVPWTCDIEQALLRFWVADGTADSIHIHRLLKAFGPEDTWQTVGDGIAVDDEEAASVSATTEKGIESYTYHWFDVKESIEHWRTHVGTNFGWAVIAGGDDEMTFYTSKWSSVRQRPRLVVQCAAKDGETPGVEDDTGGPEPQPVKVRILPETVSDTEGEPPEVELKAAGDIQSAAAVTGCECRAVERRATSPLCALMTLLALK